MSYQDNLHSTQHPSRGYIKDLPKDANLGEGVDIVVGLTATALAADQVVKLTGSKKHKAMHLAKAGLGAAVATTAFTMMAREYHEKHKKRDEEKERGRPRQLDQHRQSEHGYAESLTDSTDDERDMAVVPQRRRGASLYGYHHEEQDRSSSRSPSPTRSRGRSQTSAPDHGRKRAKSDPSWVKFLKLVRDNLEDRNRR